MQKPGRVVILNGAPRSGKSSLAHAFQASAPGRWVIWGVDAFNKTLPPSLLPGIGLRPGGERPDLEPEVEKLYGVYFAALLAYAETGFDVVADLGLHSSYSRPFDPYILMQQRLAGPRLVVVGVLCPIDVIMARRNADPQGGFYAAGQGVPAPVALWQEAVHAGKTYDLELDTSVLSPEAGAALIGSRLAAAEID
ncbi:chloramphenicol phosphotransferase CPT family protein [Devosia rhizoryzae]|uniref:Chloramphenicol phosphotransferase n=1 Tax=Devosia rhizoryzae TaxID=2774137 RepID=A0ABX7C7B3_9HYPH|nr:chloramphenicol phosphotransferase [Devosia rhizoryzae]QQR39149.1 chloramphenicol phosphotransferase [Devosia rhizoryzae]